MNGNALATDKGWPGYRSGIIAAIRSRVGRHVNGKHFAPYGKCAKRRCKIPIATGHFAKKHFRIPLITRKRLIKRICHDFFLCRVNVRADGRNFLIRKHMQGSAIYPKDIAIPITTTEVFVPTILNAPGFIRADLIDPDHLTVIQASATHLFA